MSDQHATVAVHPDGGLTLTVALRPGHGVEELEATLLGSALPALTEEAEGSGEALENALRVLGGSMKMLRDRARTLACLALTRPEWSLRSLAEHLGVHHSNVVAMLDRHRRALAELGVWVDADGVHGPGSADSLSEVERRHMARAIAREQSLMGRRYGLRFTVPERLEREGPTMLRAYWSSADHPGEEATREVPVPPLVMLVGGPRDTEHVALEVLGEGRMELEHPGARTRAVYVPDADDRSRWIYQGEVG